jgi:hypothetical protein
MESIRCHRSHSNTAGRTRNGENSVRYRAKDPLLAILYCPSQLLFDGSYGAELQMQSLESHGNSNLTAFEDESGDTMIDAVQYNNDFVESFVCRLY